MKRDINGKTKIIGIIGKNIENSLSPLIHNRIILKHSWKFCYLPFQVVETDLGKAIQGIKALNIRGANITFPYKEKVIEFLDELEEYGIVFTETESDYQGYSPGMALE